MPTRNPAHLLLPIDEHKDDRQFVTALARGLQVLKCFVSGDELLGNQEIAQRCCLPKSTVTRLTHTLTLLDFLHHDSKLGRYRLGMATLALGGTTLSRLDARDVSRPFMQTLANAVGCTVSLGVREGMSMLHIQTTHSHEALINVRLQLGSRVPLDSTAMGRAYMAGTRLPARRSLMERMRNLIPERFALIKTAIEHACDEYAASGCCTSHGQWKSDVAAIATSLRVGPGMPMMVLAASGPVHRMTPQYMHEVIRPQLLRTAWEIEQVLQPNAPRVQRAA